MPMQTLELFEKRIRLFERMIGRNIGRRVRLFEEKSKRRVERPFRLIEQKIGRNIEGHIRRFEQRKRHPPQRQKCASSAPGSRSRCRWAAVTPSGRVLARNMARYVDPNDDGPVIELGPGDRAGDRGARRPRRRSVATVLVEFNPTFCRLPAPRFPRATVVHGDAYRLRESLAAYTRHEVSAIVSGLPLMTKPRRTRLRLLGDALGLLKPDAPFVQFTYAMVPRRSRSSPGSRSRPPSASGSTCRPPGCGSIGDGGALSPIPLMPAQAGIQLFLRMALGPRFRGDKRTILVSVHRAFVSRKKWLS